MAVAKGKDIQLFINGELIETVDIEPPCYEIEPTAPSSPFDGGIGCFVIDSTIWSDRDILEFYEFAMSPFFKTYYWPKWVTRVILLLGFVIIVLAVSL